MHFAEDKSRGRYHIRGYAAGRIRINETDYRRSLIITPEQLIDDWPAQTVGDLSTELLTPVLALQPQILVLGTGKQQRFPGAAQLTALYETGIGIEIMDTAAACRTYNVLVSEDRAVVGALIIEP